MKRVEPDGFRLREGGLRSGSGLPGVAAGPGHGFPPASRRHRPEARRVRPRLHGPISDAALADRIRGSPAAGAFHCEGDRKVWKRLRGSGVLASPRRGLRCMRESGLPVHRRPGDPRGPRARDGTIAIDRVNRMWCIDLTSVRHRDPMRRRIRSAQSPARAVRRGHPRPRALRRCPGTVRPPPDRARTGAAKAGAQRKTLLLPRAAALEPLPGVARAKPSRATPRGGTTRQP